MCCVCVCVCVSVCLCVCVCVCVCVCAKVILLEDVNFPLLRHLALVTCFVFAIAGSGRHVAACTYYSRKASLSDHEGSHSQALACPKIMGVCSLSCFYFPRMPWNESTAAAEQTSSNPRHLNRVLNMCK